MKGEANWYCEVRGGAKLFLKSLAAGFDPGIVAIKVTAINKRCWSWLADQAVVYTSPRQPAAFTVPTWCMNYSRRVRVGFEVTCEKERCWAVVITQWDSV